ncbi:MAG: hypothetical protein PHH70_02210 [Candidatus Gracilibacteria bacterium]|nr:hypothetical protein [Candidatus Gracilibacteria bacterium]
MAERLQNDRAGGEVSTVSRKDTMGSQERLNNESANILATRFSTALGEKFEQKGIAFNIQDFKSKMIGSIEQVFSNPSIPDIAKEKFKQDIMSKIDLLSGVTLEDINSLKNRRAIESLGVEYIELRGKNEGEKQAFFLGKILEETIGKYIEPVAYSLVSAFNEEKTRVGSIEYGKKNLDAFNKNIGSLDTLYGLDIVGEIRTFQAERIKKGLGDISREDLYREMGQKIVAGMNKRKAIPDARRVSEFIRNGNLTDNSKGRRLTEASLPDGSKKDIVDIVLEYKKSITSFQGTESESREIRATAIADDVFAKAKKGLGMEQLKSEFDHLKPTDIEAKMKGKSFADMVIIATQLAQLAPIAGDIGGGIDGLVSAYSGMNVDGAKLTHLERGLNTIFGVLGITVLGGFAARAKNANKVKGLLESFSVMKRYLPEKFEAFLKAGGKISEEAKVGILKFAKMMGREFAEQIEGMMKKNGMILSIVPDEKGVKGISNISPNGRINTIDNNPPLLTRVPNPQLELLRIKSLPKSERKEALSELYKNLKVQTDYLVTIPDKVNELSKTIDFSHLAPDEILKSKAYAILIQDISSHIPQGHIPEIENRLLKYIEKKCTTHRYFEQMKGNPEQILRDHLGNQGIQFTGEVRAEIDGSTLVFYIAEPNDYAKVYLNSVNPIGSAGTKGFVSPTSKVIELVGSIAVVQGKKGDIAIGGVLGHELQHIKNQFLFPEKEITHREYLDMLELDSRDSKKYVAHASRRGKDEIVAFNKGGGDQFSTPLQLIKGERGNYDYLKRLRHSIPGFGDQADSEYLGKMKKSIEVADDISRKLGDNTTNTLAIFPIDKWKRLQKIYTHLDPISESQIHSLPGGGFTGTREFKGGIEHTGTFDKDGNLLDGKKKYYDFVEEGEYHANGRLKIGTQKWETGTVSEGRFDEKGFLEEGSVNIPVVGKYSGRFENNQLVEGSWERGNYIETGLFQNGTLKNGKSLDKESGTYMEGEFSKNNILLKGNWHVVNDSSVADYNMVNGQKNGYGSRVSRNGSYDIKGEFKDDIFIKGEVITQYDHTSGEFYPNGRLKSGQVIDKEHNIVTEGDFDTEGQFIRGKIVHSDWYKEGTFLNGRLHGNECTYAYKEGDIHLKDIGIFENGTFKEGLRYIDGGVSAQGSTFTGTMSTQGGFYDGLLEKADGTILKWSGGRVVDTIKKINMIQLADKYDMVMLQIMDGKRSPEDVILELENLGKTAPDNKELQKFVKTQTEDILDWKLLNSFN